MYRKPGPQRRQLMEDLRNATLLPFFTVIIVPELFPKNARRRRELEGSSTPSLPGKNEGRYTELSKCPSTTRFYDQSGNESCVDPNRQLPMPGQAFDPRKPEDAHGRDIETENIILLNLIQRYRPERIANLHAIHGTKAPGIFTDPRTAAIPGRSVNAYGKVPLTLMEREFAQDWNLALAMAEHAKDRGALVPANRVGKRNATAMYRNERVPTIDKPPEKPSRPEGSSLGDWGSHEVRYPDLPSGKADPRNRPAITTITIEIQQINKTNRAEELQSFSSSLQDIFLEDPSTIPRPTTGAH